MQKEIWKDIPGYEGIYQASSLGNIKSLTRINKHPLSGYRILKGKTLKQGIASGTYLRVGLNKNGNQIKRRIHQLVAMAFLNHNPSNSNKLVVNHIDFNKLNNNVNNLNIITIRENSNKKHIKSSSKYTGVSWCKTHKKWLSGIHLNGKSKNLGSFTNEIEASNAYQKELSKINQ